VRALMSGLSSHKGLCSPVTYFWLPDVYASFFSFFLFICTSICCRYPDFHICSLGKLTLLDISNNSISARGAFHVAEYVKKSKSLLWLNLYMNDIGDEVLIFLGS
jgi:hypothetical protein